MFVLLEETYNKLQTFVPVQPYQIQHYKKEKYFRYIHPEYIKCVADEGKLVAFVIIMPSFTKALKKANGKMFPWGIFHILKRNTSIIELLLSYWCTSRLSKQG